MHSRAIISGSLLLLTWSASVVCTSLNVSESPVFCPPTWPLSVPSRFSVPLLKLDPRWDPLRDDPRFQAMLEKYQQGGG